MEIGWLKNNFTGRNLGRSSTRVCPVP